jgi:hypothetical protein
MTEQFTIPASFDDALTLLREVGTAFMRAGWQRCALVYALTYDGDEQTNPGGVAPDGRMAPWKFAELGVVGLKTGGSVRRHRDVWAMALQDGLAEDARWGEPVVLPAADWQEYYDRAGTWTMPDTPAEALAELGATEEESESEPGSGVEGERPSVVFMRRKTIKAVAGSSTLAVNRVARLRMWDGITDPEDIALLELARDQFGTARDGLDQIVSRNLVSQ